MERVESKLEALMKEKMEFDKACMKRLRDLERERKRIYLKGNTTTSGGRDVNHCERKGNHYQGKTCEVEEGDTSIDVTRLCDLNRIDKIKKNLDNENLKLFQQSCLGHLLEINSKELIFQGQVFRQLLKHVDMDASEKERQLVFNIGNSQIRFCAKDFALVTGLRLGTLDAATTTQKSSMYENVFGGRPRITLKEVEEAFLGVSRDHKGKGELTLKLALVYFVLGILVPKDPHSAKIEVQYVQLVEDVEKFNTFCWGSVSYEFLVSVVLSARVRMDSLNFASHTKARLKIDGFVFALQIWAYEVMPSLAEYCAQNIKNGLTTQPRILRWTTPVKSIRFKNLKKFFAPGDGVDLVLHGIKREVEELSPLPKKAKVVRNKDEKCSNEDVIIIISDNDDDDDSEASDCDSCSTTFMDNYVASLHK